MNKHTLKTFAIHARQSLLKQKMSEERALTVFLQHCTLHALTAMDLYPCDRETLLKLCPELFDQKTLTDFSRDEKLWASLDRTVSREDWQKNIGILGYLLQDYHSEIREQILSSRTEKKIDRSRLSCATQLFTPHWIVSYLAENALTQLCDTGDRKWQYLLETEKTGQYRELSELRCIDPCMGCGAMLLTLFDLLFELYTAQKFSACDAVRAILGSNLYGLDIDPLAVRISRLCLRLKGYQACGRILEPDPDHFLCITGSRGQDEKQWEQLIEQEPVLAEVKQAMEQGDLTGSLIRIPQHRSVDNNTEDPGIRNTLLCARLLSLQYDLVITNPPYLSSAGMNEDLLKYVRENYPDSRFDLYACFIERCMEMSAPEGVLAMITQHSWMFISSYRKLRDKLIQTDLVNMVHLGSKAFDDIKGEVVQTTAFVLQKRKTENRKALVCRVVEGNNEKQKEALFLSGKNRYRCTVEQFLQLPGHPVAYWLDQRVIDLYRTLPPLKNFAAPRKGNSTSDNRRFLRMWYEVDPAKLYLHQTVIDREKTRIQRWIPYNKGGGYRRWYGNNLTVIDWYDNASAIRSIPTSVIANEKWFMKPGLTWSTLSMDKFSIRWFDEGYIFDNGGCCLFDLQERRAWFCALLNSKVFEYIFSQLNPTLNFQSGQVAGFPVRYIPDQRIDALAMDCIRLSREDEACSEITRDFTIHPLLRYRGTLQQCLQQVHQEFLDRFMKMKDNEEKLNELFIALYGLQDLITPQVKERDITVHRILFHEEELEESMKGSAMILSDRQVMESLVSYATGCILHRFDPSHPGVQTPVCDLIPVKELAQKICQWVADHFDDPVQSLETLARLLNGHADPLESVTEYMENEFYRSHCRTYLNRPVYWQITSGPLKAYQAVFSIHGIIPSRMIRQLRKQLKETQKHLQDKDRIQECQQCLEALEKIRTFPWDLDNGVIANRKMMKEKLKPLRL